MALTKAQVEAIKRQQKKNIAQRAAVQKTKISAEEARSVSHKLHKRPGVTPSYVRKDTNVISNSAASTMKKQAEINAAKEKFIQKNRNLAKRLAGETVAKGKGKLPMKERVGTNAEYKQLGKEIKTRRELIAAAKAARAAQAERAKNPKAKKAAPAAKATPVEETKPVAKKSTPAKTTAKKSTPAKKTAAAPKPKLTSTTPRKKPLTAAQKKASLKAATKEIAANTPADSAKVNDSPGKSKSTKPKTQKSKTPKAPKAPKLQTLEEAKSKAPTPKGPMEGPAKPIKGPLVDQPRFFPGPQAAKVEAPAKATVKGKVASKVASTKVGKVAKAAKAASKPIAEAASKTTTGKILKKVKPGAKAKFLGKAAAVAVAAKGVGSELAQIGSGQTSKDFKRIQALENRIAIAKGEKRKYTSSGVNRNLLASAKVDVGSYLSAATGGLVGKSTKERLQELKVMLAKTQKKAGNKPPAKSSNKTPTITTPGGQKVGGGTSKTLTGNKYTVKKGDTLSAIASRSGVSLKELRAANPKFTAQAKYKGGNTIFSGTTVAIPKKKAK